MTLPTPHWPETCVKWRPTPDASDRHGHHSPGRHSSPPEKVKLYKRAVEILLRRLAKTQKRRIKVLLLDWMSFLETASVYTRRWKG